MGYRISPRAGGGDVMIAIIFAFIIACMFPLLKLGTDSVGAKLEDQGFTDTDVNLFKPSEMESFYNRMDILPMAVLIIATLSAGFLAVMAPSNPFFFFLTIILIVITAVFAVVISNAYETLSNTTNAKVEVI